MTGMSEERLADQLAMHRWLRDITRSRDERGALEQRTSNGWTTHADAVDAFSTEIDRLRAELAATKAENERLRSALEELTDWDYCRNSSGWGPCAGPAREHESNCPMRVAYAALNPDPAP